MTPADQFLQFIANQSPATAAWLVIKWIYLFGILIYVAFALIVVRQVGLMSRTVEGNSLNIAVKMIAWIHFLVSVVVLLLAFSFL
jgi:hypothetical protein